MHQLRVGAPLPFDTYDADGKLLLVRGYVIESRDQLERLVERGLYSDFMGRGPSAGPGPEPDEPQAGASLSRGRLVSVFELLAAQRRLLDETLRAPPESGFPAAIASIARELLEACAVDGDAALGAIMMARRERYTVRHAVDVVILADILLRHLEQPEGVRMGAACAALTMNIAVAELQDMLYGQEAPLDEEQKRRIRAHPNDGEARLRELGVADPEWLRAVREHHEAFDGTGYAAQLAGDAIGLPAQVVGLADRYCAKVSERVHRPASLPNLALREVYAAWGGKSVHPRLVRLLVQATGVYPPGTIVQLANGETAVAVKRSPDARHPVVRVVRDAKGTPLTEYHKRLTSDPAYAVTGVLPFAKLTETIDRRKLWPPLRIV